MNYSLSNTLNFTYNDKEVWGTIIEFGNDWVKMITQNGFRTYHWDKMTSPVVYQCKVSELIKSYQYHGDSRFEYLYNYYGPYVPPYPWKED